jgi:hypothetical protein
MKTISYGLGFLILTGLGAQGLHAHELSNCTMFSDFKSGVVERVRAVKHGRVSAGPKISLFSKPENACNTDDLCIVPATVPLNAGREGIEMGRNQSWVCVAVPGKRPLDVWVGWLPEKRWQQTDFKQDLKDWTGVWQNGHAKLKINLTETQQLSATGHALWIGGAMGISHFGDFDITGMPDNGVLVTSSSGSEEDVSCQIALRLVGKFIFAADNRRCGGMNVTFGGMYRFRTGQKP